MLTLISKIFIKNQKEIKKPEVRNAWGVLTAVYTIFLNIMLFVAKYVIGTISGSVSIIADSFNNLGDVGNSLVTVFGFKFAGMKPDDDHPFGHGRIEYLTGLLVSAMILVVGYSTLRDAIDTIITPKELEFSVWIVIILVLSILMKFYMWFYSKRIGGKIDSQVLKTNAADCLTDTISTAMTLACVLLYKFFGWHLDGWAALIVSLLLFKTAIQGAWETIKELLGKKADSELVQRIYEIVSHYPEIIGIHDMIVHDYGPGRLYVSLHCEVSGNGNIYELHDAVDRCMEELDHTLGCESVIHMDPINVDDGITLKTREKTQKLLREKIDSCITIHDFRIVPGPTHDNILFDALVPRTIKMSDEELNEKMQQVIRENFEHTTFAIIKIDRPYA